MLKNLKEKYVPKSEPTAAADDGGADLVTILDRSQRGDLMLLVMKITEAMRDGIVRNFDATPSPPPPTTTTPPKAATTTRTSSSSDRDSVTTTASTASTAPTRYDAHSTDSPKKPIPGPKPVPKPKPKSLESNPQPKRRDTAGSTSVKDAIAEADALSHFGDWTDSLLLRVGNVVNNDDREEGEEKNNVADIDFDDGSYPNDNDQVDDDLVTLHKVYPPIETPLARLPRAKRLLILHSLLLLMLSLKHYNAYSRVFMVRLISSLGLYLQDLNGDESKVARGLLDAAIASPDTEGQEQEQEKKGDSSRKWKVGIASVAGAALIGVTGGLAAPLVAAGLGTVMGGLGLGATAAAGYLGVLAGSGVVVGGLFGAYGGRMTGQMMDKYAREVEDFAFIPIRGGNGDGRRRRRFFSEKEAAQQDHRLRVTIGITGWVTDEENYVVPWRVIGQDTEVFALRWELESLMNLGNAISALVTSAAWGVAGREILSRTVFAGIMQAVMLPMGLMKISRVVDNPFSVAKARADKAGRVLADVLINKAQGERPVTLIGYSLGSRVIYSCLQTLAKRHAYGLVESAILLGSPTPSDADDWRTMRSVVSGRLVNVFSKNDTVLAFLYRTSSFQLGVAGLQPVEQESASGVENVDVSDLISGHLRYQFLVGKILRLIRLEDVDIYELSREILALHDRDRAQEQERIRNERRAEIERRRKESGPGTADGAVSASASTVTGRSGSSKNKDDTATTNEVTDEEGQRLQRQVERRTQERLMRRKVERMELQDDGQA